MKRKERNYYRIQQCAKIAWLHRRRLVLELSSLLVLHYTWSLGFLAANNSGLEKMYSESWWVSQGASSLFHINLFWNCHISTKGSHKSPKYKRIFKIFFLLSSLDYSKIWLIPLVDNYIRKLKINKPLRTKQFTRIIFSQYEEKWFLHYFSAWRKGLKNRQIFYLTFALKE
jgi:hypothetical protein